MKNISLSVITFVSILIGTSCNGQTLLFPHTNPAPSAVTFAWNAPFGPTPAGYNLYWGTGSRQYTSITNVGPALSCTLTNLLYGTNYFFAATAYTAAGLESPFSGEISYTPIQSATNTPPPPPTMKPVVVLTADIWITVDQGQVAVIGGSLAPK